MTSRSRCLFRGQGSRRCNKQPLGVDTIHVLHGNITFLLACHHCTHLEPNTSRRVAMQSESLLSATVRFRLWRIDPFSLEDMADQVFHKRWIYNWISTMTLSQCCRLWLRQIFIISNLLIWKTAWKICINAHSNFLSLSSFSLIPRCWK